MKTIYKITESTISGEQRGSDNEGKQADEQGQHRGRADGVAVTVATPDHHHTKQEIGQ